MFNFHGCGSLRMNDCQKRSQSKAQNSLRNNETKRSTLFVNLSRMATPPSPVLDDQDQNQTSQAIASSTIPNETQSEEVCIYSAVHFY